MAQLVSPGVSVSVTDATSHVSSIPQVVPLIILATRSNKTINGVITPGTSESNKLRLLTSQRELLTNYGTPTFVTSGGIAVNGEETNEYGLYAAYEFLGRSSRAFVIRSDVDMGQLVPRQTEPVLPPADGTFWIKPSNIIGGIFKYDGTSWTGVNFSTFMSAPTGANGNDGDWSFDYSTMNGTIKYKQGGIWKAASNTNLAADFGASVNLHTQPTTPAAPTVGDYWYKTTNSGGGTNISLGKYRSSDGVFVITPIVRNSVMPNANQNVIWEDLSQIAASGNHPLYIGTGSAFLPLTAFVQELEPFTAPATGTNWFDDTHNDFAMYMEGNDVGRGNEWVPITTTITSNPSNIQKVISATAPTLPQADSIWIDISTPSNLDSFPVVKKYIGGTWIDISNSIMIQDVDPDATAVINGTYWVNTSESKTRNIVKSYDPAYNAVTVVLNTSNGKYEVVTEANNKWKPISNKFGRVSVRDVVVKSLQGAINSNNDIRNDGIIFHIIACPGYPELYDEMNALNVDIKETAFILVDCPKYATLNAITATNGRAIGVNEWITNSRNATITGEDGFAGTKSPYAATYYPWMITSNVDGSNIFVPPSAQIMRTLAFNDSVGHPWTAPAGVQRGRVDLASSVGHLDENDVYQSTLISPGQADSLYLNNINPIMLVNGNLLVYGQKTLFTSNTALDRINVARLVTTIKRNMFMSLQPYLFQANNAGTRRAVKTLVDRYLAGITAFGGLYDHLVICDATNNTPTVIDSNQLLVDVFIKPTKTVEFINVNLTLVNTGTPLG